MKNQLSNVVEILIQILVAVFISTAELLLIVGKLLYELYINLQIMAHTSIVGVFVAIFIGGLVIFFSGKFLFDSTTSVIKIMTIYIVIVAILLSLASPGST
jgi:hypothetical protein